MAQQFSLRWNNYLDQITNAFDSLKSEEDLIDVTLSCEGKKLKAHKMLLSACSPYFRDIFKENPCQHPVIVFRNFRYVDLEAIIDFMYKGEVDVKQENFESFLATAELLEVKGLTDGSGRRRFDVEEDSDASKTFGSEADLLPEEPNPASSITQPVSSQVSRSPPAKKRKSQSSVTYKNQKSSEKKQKSTDSHALITPKIEKEDFVEDLTFDDGDTDDSHSTNADLSQVPMGHSTDYSSGSMQIEPDLGQLPKGLIHAPEPGSSMELTPDIMQTDEIMVQATENKFYIESDVGVKVQGELEKRCTLSDSKLGSASNNSADIAKTKLIPTNIETVVKGVIQKQESISKPLHEDVLKSKALNLPKGLTVSMKGKSPTCKDSKHTVAEQTALRSEKAKTPIQEESLANQEQLPEMVSDMTMISDQVTFEEPEMAEEAPQMTSDAFVSEAIQEEEQEIAAEENIEPEFDYFGCDVCKSECKPVDKFNLVLSHKCPICPCACFCAHLLKEHMKVIHGWFNVQRRFKQY